MGDIAAMIAPRPLLIETGSRDPLNGASGLANVRSQVHIIRRAYRTLGAEDRCITISLMASTAGTACRPSRGCSGF